MATLYANPYDVGARGFYFEDETDFEQKQKSNLNSFGMPVEEYSFEFISGDDAEHELFNALEDNGFINLNDYFQTLREVNDDQIPALVYLVGVMNLDIENALDNVDDVYVYEGDAKDYINNEFIPEIMFDLSNLNENLIDFKALGRDFDINHLELREMNLPPSDLGYYVYSNEDWLDENLENVRNYGISPDYYIDEDALIEGLQNDQQIDEFRIKGKTYTITNVMDVQEMRNNPALCKDGHISSSGMPQPMGAKWQKSYPMPKHARGVCTKHGGVDTVLTKKEYEKLKPKRLQDFNLKGDDDFVTYREERHPKVGKAIAFAKKKKAKAKSKKKNPPSDMSLSELLYIRNLMMSYQGTFGSWVGGIGESFCDWYTDLMQQLMLSDDGEMNDFLVRFNLVECPATPNELSNILYSQEVQSHPMFSVWARSLRDNF